MNLFIVIIYLIILSFIFSYLDKKYKFVAKFELKVSKKFNILVNLMTVVSLIALLFLAIYEDYIVSLGLSIGYFQAIIGVPLVFRSYISTTISEMDRLRKEERKKRDVEIKFCYYCGSDLNGTNICPSCGKELEL